MLSGIGPATEPSFHGIEVVIDQPLVGQGMAGNPMNELFIPSPIEVETSLIQVVGITEFDSYIEAASGSSLSGVFMQNLHKAAQILSSQACLPKMWSFDLTTPLVSDGQREQQSQP